MKKRGNGKNEDSSCKTHPRPCGGAGVLCAQRGAGLRAGGRHSGGSRPVTLSLPAGSLILTRETPVDDAIFETLNVDGAAILENMNKNDLYLDAVLFKPPLEFTLVRVQLPSNSLIDWENSEDAQLCAFVESIYEQLDNITADDCSVYSSEQGIRFVRANILVVCQVSK